MTNRLKSKSESVVLQGIIKVKAKSSIEARPEARGEEMEKEAGPSVEESNRMQF